MGRRKYVKIRALRNCLMSVLQSTNYIRTKNGEMVFEIVDSSCPGYDTGESTRVLENLEEKEAYIITAMADNGTDSFILKSVIVCIGEKYLAFAYICMYM